ncbi:unnamed protein product [Trichogramma brassicae]|uniref:Uncharacterized protein n=1 Tax=Trichogramma brassicae TaxID=86971 RepID=A0A6H5J779_9HYME|nr:unnamed protein product [Trichogramma brassicae]
MKGKITLGHCVLFDVKHKNIHLIVNKQLPIGTLALKRGAQKTALPEVLDASINCLSITIDTLLSSIVLIFFAFTSQGSSDFFFLLFSAPRIGIDLLCRLSSISGSAAEGESRSARVRRAGNKSLPSKSLRDREGIRPLSRRVMAPGIRGSESLGVRSRTARRAPPPRRAQAGCAQAGHIGAPRRRAGRGVEHRRERAGPRRREPAAPRSTPRKQAKRPLKCQRQRAPWSPSIGRRRIEESGALPLRDGSAAQTRRESDRPPPTIRDVRLSAGGAKA